MFAAKIPISRIPPGVALCSFSSPGKKLYTKREGRHGFGHFSGGIEVFSRRFIFGILVCAIFLSVGCGTLKNGRKWGEDAFSQTSLERVGRAAFNAFFDWQTLVPAAGALLFRIDDYDAKVSDWAVKHRPIFQSDDAARSASDYLYVGFFAESLATALATPSGEDKKEWAYSKMKGLAVEGLAMGLTGGVTVLWRNAEHRTTPDNANNYSFPSGHASGAFSAVAMSNRNLDSISMPEKARFAIQAGNIFLATAMGWARVEEGRHYPTDILVGAALGHFLTTFIHDSLIGLPETNGFGFSVLPMRGGAVGQLHFTY
jgi:membrane-associated phospholipid phosphatase